MEMSGRLHAPAALPQGKSPGYPTDKKLGGIQSWYGRDGEEKKYLHLPGIKPRRSSPISIIY
jgi:hypothetical protein